MGQQKRCFVVGHLSCVGYQSRLFPVCVNSLPHCLGYLPPMGVTSKRLGLVGKSQGYQAYIAGVTGHKVWLLQFNLLIKAFVHLALIFPRAPTLQLAWHRLTKVKALFDRSHCWNSWSLIFELHGGKRSRKCSRAHTQVYHPQLCITSFLPAVLFLFCIADYYLVFLCDCRKKQIMSAKIKWASKQDFINIHVLGHSWSLIFSEGPLCIAKRGKKGVKG